HRNGRGFVCSGLGSPCASSVLIFKRRPVESSALHLPALERRACILNVSREVEVMLHPPTKFFAPLCSERDSLAFTTNANVVPRDVGSFGRNAQLILRGRQQPLGERDLPKTEGGDKYQQQVAAEVQEFEPRANRRM